MTCRAGFIWETPQYFNRFIEECGISCELITPHMLAAPFWRQAFSCLIIPTGFGNATYSNLLPALRASSGRIRRFVENGGNMLIFGAAADKADAYDWLPFSLTYHHDCSPRNIQCIPVSDAAVLIGDYDPDHIECDGSFPSHDGTCTGRAGQSDVIIEKRIGKGRIVVTSVHEYPSREFIKKFCNDGIPTLL